MRKRAITLLHVPESSGVNRYKERILTQRLLAAIGGLAPTNAGCCGSAFCLLFTNYRTRKQAFWYSIYFLYRG